MRKHFFSKIFWKKIFSGKVFFRKIIGKTKFFRKIFHQILQGRQLFGSLSGIHSSIFLFQIVIVFDQKLSYFFILLYKTHKKKKRQNDFPKKSKLEKIICSTILTHFQIIAPPLLWKKPKNSCFTEWTNIWFFFCHFLVLFFYLKNCRFSRGGNHFSSLGILRVYRVYI